MRLNLAAFLPRSTLNGPGERAVVWAQGCPRAPACQGCVNPGMLDTARVVELVEVEELAERILAEPALSGVTFSGGEPFHQAAPLAALAGLLGALAPALTLTVFSGYALEELAASQRSDWRALLQRIDLLIDGPYREALACDEPLRASANQRLHLLTGRIRPADVETIPAASVEVFLDARGQISFTGVPPRGLLEGLRRDLAG
jgi:anaerobic ribonucleoside-triphosphate reductase activating protein